MERRDELQESVRERDQREPGFSSLVEAFALNDALVDALTEAREASGMSQRELARRMHSTQSEVSRLESGDIDPRLSTVSRYAGSLHKIIRWHIEDATSGAEVLDAPMLATAAEAVHQSAEVAVVHPSASHATG